MMKASDFRREARESLRGHKGKAGGTYLIYLIVSDGISFVVGIIPLLGSIIGGVITAGILYGCVTVLMRIKRNQEVSAAACLEEGFGNCIKILCCNFWISIELLLWTILFVIAMLVFTFGIDNNIIVSIIGLVFLVFTLFKLIVKSLRFSLVNFLVYDNPNLRAKEIVNKSEEMMKVNKNVERLFTLNLSFVGWYILFYIGMYVAAYFFALGSMASLFGGNPLMGIIGIVGYVIVLFASVFFLVPYVQMANICFYEKLVGTNEDDSINNVIDNAINEDNGGIAII